MNPRFGRRPSYSVLLRESEAVAKRLPATASPDLPLPDDGSPESVLRTARYSFSLMLVIIGGPLRTASSTTSIWRTPGSRSWVRLRPGPK
jgi:hypothetical protein